MPEKRFFDALDPLDPEGDRLRYRIVYEHGRVTAFSVQYEARIGPRHRAVIRYDSAHGEAHRDLLDVDGRNIDKRWLGKTTLPEALAIARQDLKANWRHYRAAFLERIRGIEGEDKGS